MSSQMAAGMVPPVTFLVGELSSLPTQTPADELGRIADKPGVAVILAGAGLAGDVVACDRRAPAGAVRHDLAQHGVHGTELQRADDLAETVALALVDAPCRHA